MVSHVDYYRISLPMNRPVRLLVITGLPGTGKTSVSEIIRPRLDPGWTVLHGDDFIGITMACYPGKQWEEIRGFLPYFAGWSAGNDLSDGRSVLLEAHLRDREEIARLNRGVRDLFGRDQPPEVVVLEGDQREIAGRLAGDTFREPDWQGRDRVSKFLAWLRISALDPLLPGTRIEVRGLTEDALARKVAAVFGIRLG
jgi:adenylate kinase